MSDRKTALEHWLQQVLPNQTFHLTVASADASFRRYFRVHVAEETFIAMDAPPAHEDCRPFVQVAQLLAETGVNVPKIMAQNIEEGFLLLTDLGNDTYLSQLNAQNAAKLYGDATTALVSMQLSTQAQHLPPYDEALLMREMQLFPDWFLAKHLGKTLTEAENQVLQTTFKTLNANILAQPKVLVHRDYHSRNLMICNDNPGILDFQDAVFGPVTYDLVSLLKDAYIRWDEDLVIDWAVRYWQKARKAGLAVDDDFSMFYRDFEWMGAQRHIKVLGVFARLYHRDGKAGYLKDMPLVMDYLRQTCERYVELRPFSRLLNGLVMPKNP